MGIFPSLLPTGCVNLSGQLRIHPEGRWSPSVPQLDVFGGYWDMAWAEIVANQAKDDVSDAAFNGYYFGAMATASLSPRARVFAGYKHSALTAKLTLKKTQKILGTDVNSFKSGLRDDFLITGIEIPTGVSKWWSLQLNYGFATKTVASKVTWCGKNFELGLNIYPEGVIVVHPVWNFHVYF